MVSQGWGRDLVASYAAQALTEPDVDFTLPHSKLALLTEGRAYVFFTDRSKREGVDQEGAKKAARALTGMVCWRSNDWFCSARPVPVATANEALNTVLKCSKVQGAHLSQVVGGFKSPTTPSCLPTQSPIPMGESYLQHPSLFSQKKETTG